jgi:hypothetical protein
MTRLPWMKGLLILGLFLFQVGLAGADRVLSTRSRGMKNTGARRDITVPYLNHGWNNFQGYAVAVRIRSEPIVDDPRYNGARQVYNLPFYGGVIAFGGISEGAVLRLFFPSFR